MLKFIVLPGLRVTAIITCEFNYSFDSSSQNNNSQEASLVYSKYTNISISFVFISMIRTQFSPIPSLSKSHTILHTDHATLCTHTYKKHQTNTLPHTIDTTHNRNTLSNTFRDPSCSSRGNCMQNLTIIWLSSLLIQ